MASAAQVEQIIDGGFEETTCPSSGANASFECESLAWPEIGEAFVCRMPPCGDGPATGSGFFSFGGVGFATEEEDKHGETLQAVKLPTAPATLTFKVEEREVDPYGSLSVNFDRAEVAHLEHRASTYQEITIDLSAFVGPGAHRLMFFSTCFGGEAGSNCSIFNIDDVSIKTGEPDSPAPPIAPVAKLPTPAPHKCKKGFRRKSVKGGSRCVKAKHHKRHHAHKR